MKSPCKDQDSKYGCVYWNYLYGQCDYDDECPYDNGNENENENLNEKCRYDQRTAAATPRSGSR